MSEFSPSPRAVIVSPDIYSQSVKQLTSMGIEVLFSCKNTNVSPYLAYHADMQISRIGDNTYITAPECFDYYSGILKKYNVNIVCGNTKLSCNYPGDIAYNIIVTEKYAIHNFKHTDPVLKSMINDKKLINVSQGYTACTLCVLPDNIFITSDKGIYASLQSHSTHILCIDDSSILLPGFDHGFFGGSVLSVNNNTLAVNGNAPYHSDYKKINEFCREHGFDLISLSDKPIMDIGSFVKIF